MHTHTVDSIRNIALVGHGAVGKTSLADALLFRAHAVDRQGSVDDGTSVSDYDEEEHKRHFSIDTTFLHAEHHDKDIHLLDAPGYPDFVGAALEALNAVETAAIVISATSGIEVNTRRMFAEASKRGLGRVLVINKLDAENVQLPELLANIRATFGKQCVLFNLPDGVGSQFTRVYDLLDENLKPPAGLPLDFASARSQLTEAVAECDEALTEKFLMEVPISHDELVAAIPKAIAAGTVIPIFCTSAKKGIGVTELLDALAEETLPPEYHKFPAEIHVEAIAKGEFIGQVFKTVTDKFVGHLSFIRVFQGKLQADSAIVNLTTGKTARIGSLLLMQGKQHKTVSEALPGDIVAVAKVEGLHIGDTVAATTHAPRLPSYSFPTPMYGLAIEPKKRGDEQKISQSLAKIADEDPTFKVSHDPQTHELVVSGVSQLHLDVIQHRLKQRFDLEVVTKEPKIPYRETISKPAAGDYRHKKQSGGRGQFGEVHLRIFPLSAEIRTHEQLLEQFATKDRFEKLRAVHYDPDHNFAFLDTIVGGTIPNQFIPAVEKGCKELLERGALAGYRMQNLAVEVYFGKDHPVDSSEAAFKIAGRLAMKRAFLAAGPTLLEPIVHLEVTVPSRFTGAVLGDLNTKRGRVENQDSLPGDLTLIVARAPLAEVTRYAAQLNSITQGQGSYAMDFSHYDMVPSNIVQQLVAKAKLADDEEE